MGEGSEAQRTSPPATVSVPIADCDVVLAPGANCAVMLVDAPPATALGNVASGYVKAAAFEVTVTCADTLPLFTTEKSPVDVVLTGTLPKLTSVG
jgi:hypothetical protein